MLDREERCVMAKSENQIGFRVTDEFKARLLAQAEKERRSISNLIINVLTDYLDNAEKNKDAE